MFEELLVNALVHRDYLVSAPIRLFIFDNRINIISPGHLPNHLTVAKMRTGNSIIRNPILASYIAKGLLPYKGLGSGIKRALEDWPEIDFTDDRDGCLFTATVHRKVEDSSLVKPVSREHPIEESPGSGKSSQKGSQKSSQKIIEIMRNKPEITIAELAQQVGISDRAVKKQIARLEQQNVLRRIGPDKGGRWDISDS